MLTEHAVQRASEMGEKMILPWQSVVLKFVLHSFLQINTMATIKLSAKKKI